MQNLVALLYQNRVENLKRHKATQIIYYHAYFQSSL